jgi:Gpi18-like mannosyltransferase
MKLQAIIFIPLWGLLLISSLHRNRRWKDVAYIIPAMLLIQALLLLPFHFGKGGLLPVWNAVAGLANTSPYTSMNAFNMWFWIVGDEAVRDNVRSLFGLTYYQIGLISFCLASLIAMWPVLRHTITTLSTRDTPALPRETIWLTAALVTLAFFFFSTGMHERYSHAAFIFITAYSFYHRKFGLYALFSLAYLLNLDKVLHGLRIASYHTLIFDPNFIAALFALCILWTVILLYRQAHRDRAAELAILPPKA